MAPDPMACKRDPLEPSLEGHNQYIISWGGSPQPLYPITGAATSEFDTAYSKSNNASRQRAADR